MIPLFGDIQNALGDVYSQNDDVFKLNPEYNLMDANSNWVDVQQKYNKFINAGKKHDDAIKELQKEYRGIGPQNQERLKNGYKPPAPTPGPTPTPPPAPTPTPPPTPTPSTGKQTEAGLKPVLITIAGREHAYQTPKNPKGLFVFLHGCSRSIFGAWPKSSNGKFFGLPEDVSRTKQVLKMGYAILYPSPSNRGSGCFSAGADGTTVVNVIKQIRSSLGLNGKPLYLSGCSAGGGMIQRLVAGGSIQCNGMINESATTADPTNKTPASVWVCLSTSKEQGVGKQRVSQLSKFGKPAGMLVSGKRKVYPEYFSDQIASISVASSKKIVEALKRNGIVDASGNVKSDPKGDKAWYNQLKNSVNIPETTIGFWNSSVVQAMLVAYAVHDAISVYTTAFLRWAESGFKGDLQALGKQYVVTKPAYISI